MNQQSAFPNPRTHELSYEPTNLRTYELKGNDLAYQRAEVTAMPQKSNDPGTAEPRASIPQEQDDELEMADDDEDFTDDEDFDDESELEDDDVEE
jgi:hypothetical protein